jgi:arylsulfatase A-like enzyme
MPGEITRRHLIAAGLGVALTTAVAGSAGRERRPNVLVVLADDLGWADLSCYGSPHIRTPHLDGLAADGARFTSAYAAAPVCSPTRFALYTGRYPGRLEGGLQEPISGPDERHGIPPQHPTLASLLKQAGYATAMVGKWERRRTVVLHGRAVGEPVSAGNADTLHVGGTNRVRRRADRPDARRTADRLTLAPARSYGDHSPERFQWDGPADASAAGSGS